MRLRRITIKNFRSIFELIDFEFVDLGITCFIGGNGTGKSNILRAISYLEKEGPSDNDFYAKAEDSDDESIIIAEFIFENKDVELFESEKLAFGNMQGFYVNVEKKRGKEALISFKPVDSNQDMSDSWDEIELKVNNIKELTKAIQPTDQFVDIKNRILNILNEIGPEISDYEQKVTEIEQAAQEIEGINPGSGSGILNNIQEIRKYLPEDLTETIEDIFNKLTIELLNFDTYIIENSAPISELSDDTKHPFLYDLLYLADRYALDFNVSGARLQRRKESASRTLSSRISEIWLTHALNFNIDRQGDSLIFTVYTQQHQQIDLTDLSEGEKWFLRFYTRLAIAKLKKVQVLWLFDEPGRDLHSSSQIDLKRLFEDISKTSQIIYTTHHAMMVPWHRLERIFVVENSDECGTLVHKRFWKDAGLNSPLKEALSTFVGEEFFSGKQHIIIEGISDYFYLQGWLLYFKKQRTAQIWQKEFEQFNRVMLPVDGFAKIPLYCWFLGRQTKKKVNWVAVVDSKEDENATRKILEETGLGSWNKNAVSIGDLAKINADKTIEEIENLFTFEEYTRIFHEYYKKNYPTCNLPKDDEIRSKLSEYQKTNVKITKVITNLLQEMNPALQINGKKIELDKTGVAKQIYLILTQEKDLPFGVETVSNFENVFKAINKLLPKQN